MENALRVPEDVEPVPRPLRAVPAEEHRVAEREVEPEELKLQIGLQPEGADVRRRDEGAVADMRVLPAVRVERRGHANRLVRGLTPEFSEQRPDLRRLVVASV